MAIHQPGELIGEVLSHTVGTQARIYALHRVLGIVAVLGLAFRLAALWAADFVEFTLSQLLLRPD